ncbi:hypothetical protein HDV64DRAFT_130969 [Trichoderma sp. TUCIM 5745]
MMIGNVGRKDALHASRLLSLRIQLSILSSFLFCSCLCSREARLALRRRCMTLLMTCIQLTQTCIRRHVYLQRLTQVEIAKRIECASRLGQGCPEEAPKRSGPLGYGSPCGCALNAESPLKAKGRCGAAAAVQKGHRNCLGRLKRNETNARLQMSKMSKKAPSYAPPCVKCLGQEFAFPMLLLVMLHFDVRIPRIRTNAGWRHLAV